MNSGCRRPRPFRMVHPSEKAPGTRLDPVRRRLARALSAFFGLALLFLAVVGSPFLSELRRTIFHSKPVSAADYLPLEPAEPEPMRQMPPIEFTYSEPIYIRQPTSCLASSILRMASPVTAGEVLSPKDLIRPVEAAAPLPVATEESLARQSALAEQPAIKIHVKHEGWYRITSQELIAAGLAPKADPRKLQLFVDAHEVPMLVPGEQDGRLDPQDTVEFYGMGVASPFTSTRIYWLVSGGRPGRRITRIGVEGSANPHSGFPITVERQERTTYFSSLRNGDKENFFGPLVGGNPLEQILYLHHLDRESPKEETVLSISLQGTNQASHRIRVDFNDRTLGEIAFEGQAFSERQFALSPGLLGEGENLVRLTPLAGEKDFSLLDAIRLTYRHSYSADDNALRFTAQAQEQVVIEGFQQPDIRVFDLTFPDDVFELPGKIRKRPRDYSVLAAMPKQGTRQVLALSGAAAKKPAALHINRPSELRRRQSDADLMVITPHGYISIMEPLKAARQKQGLQVTIVDVEDVFDEFSFGCHTPQAIKAFLQYVWNQERKKPRFVLLAGDASLDPKGHRHNEQADLIPTRLIDTQFMETASDDWLADFDGDGLAEIAVGRLPFNVAAEAARMVSRILQSEIQSLPEEMLMIADDGYSGYDFAAATTLLRAVIPAAIKVRQINRAAIEAGAAKQQMLEALQHGPGFVNYMGHGSVNLWRGNLLTSDEARTLSGLKRPPLFVMMTCLNGYFVDPALESVAEGLMKAEKGGALAVWTSSGQTEPGEQLQMNREFLKLLFATIRHEGAPLTLGEAILKAKASVTNQDIRRTWILFGDPSMPLHW